MTGCAGLGDEADRRVVEQQLEGREIPPADPDALLGAVRKFREQRETLRRPLHRDVATQFTPQAIGAEVRSLIGELTTTGTRQ